MRHPLRFQANWDGMGFIEVAQGWLREQAERGVESVLPADFDMAKRRAVMWEALRGLDPAAQAEAHSRWSADGQLERFVTEVVAGLKKGLGAPRRSSTYGWLADAAIRAAVRGTELTEREAGSSLMKFELDRVVRQVKARVDEESGYNVDIPAWCRELAMLGADGVPGPIGRALLSLVGRDAVVFVLELEVALSTGVEDSRRISHELLRSVERLQLFLLPGQLTRLKRGQIPLGRLRSLGIVNEHLHLGADAESSLTFALTPTGQDLVRTVLDPAPNPFRALVRALLDAERGRVSTEITGQQTTGSEDLAYVQMVVHELRNINYPLNNSVRRLWAELDRPNGPDPAKIAEYRQRIDAALERVNNFANDSARLATASASETFALVEVVREAISTTEADRNGRIAVVLDGLPDAQLEGARARWVLLFVNLLRNSAQVRAGKGSVWISAAPVAEGWLNLFIDDDGPGVPEEYRERVFERGHSTRGGTGIGLHDGRATVRLSGGTIVCAASPRGGARFHIQVPARRSA